MIKSSVNGECSKIMLSKKIEPDLDLFIVFHLLVFIVRHLWIRHCMA